MGREWNKRNFFVFIFCCFLTTLLNAQTIEINGVISDSTGNKPVSGVFIMAVRIKDSLLCGYDRTNIDGSYSLRNLPNDTFKLTISHTNYDEKQLFVVTKLGDKIIQLPTIPLVNHGKQLDEALIFVNRGPIYYKGDTLVFVADSFKVKENAVAEDLLRKLPGVKIDSKGKITFQGKDIDQIYVDGDEFFGADPTVATKNIDADALKNVQIYEKKTADTDGEESKQILNLTLKEEAKKGYFGKTSLASDGKKFYEGELLYNTFKNNRNFSLYGLNNNTPRSGFDWEDSYNFNIDGNETNREGFPWNLKLGARYKYKYGKKKQHEFNISYDYKKNTIQKISKNNTQYIFQDTSYFNQSVSKSKDVFEENGIRIYNGIKLDSLTLLSITPQITFQQSSYNQEETSDYLNNSRTSFRNSTNQYNNQIQKTIFTNEVSLVKDYFKKDRSTSFTNTFNYELQHELGNVLFSSKQPLQLLPSTNQKNGTNYQEFSASTTLLHVEPITKKITLNLEYFNQFDTYQKNKQVEDLMSDGSYIVNYLYTSDFTKVNQTNRFKLSVSRKKGFHTFLVGTNVRDLRVKNTNKYTDVTFSQHVTNYLPYLSYTFNKKNALRMNVSYTTNSSIPDINQIQPVLSNTNQNYRTIGNLDLKPNFTHQGRVWLYKYNSLKRRYLSTTLYANFVQNEFSNSLSYDSLGRTISQTINVDGNYIFGNSLHFSMDIPKTPLGISFTLRANASRNANVINQKNYQIFKETVEPELGISFYKDSINFNVSSSIAYNNARGGSISNTSSTYYVYKNQLGFGWDIFQTGIRFETSLVNYKNTGRSQGYNLDRTIINASLHRSFLTTKKLIVSFEGNDLLNQNIQLTRTIDFNQISDFSNQIIARYFLVRILYKLKS